VLVLDKREADVFIAAFSEADAGGDCDFGLSLQ
jgi:hypothetical protein